jgi:hypothetical protein
MGLPVSFHKPGAFFDLVAIFIDEFNDDILEHIFYPFEHNCSIACNEGERFLIISSKLDYIVNGCIVKREDSLKIWIRVIVIEAVAGMIALCFPGFCCMTTFSDGAIQLIE